MYPMSNKPVVAIDKCLQDTVILRLEASDIEAILRRRTEFQEVFHELNRDAEEMDQLLHTSYVSKSKSCMTELDDLILSPSDNDAIENGDQKNTDQLASIQNAEQIQADEKIEVTKELDEIIEAPLEHEADLQIKDEDALHHAGKDHSAAIAIWLGILIDGIPESIVIGIIAAESLVGPLPLVVGVFLSNFPEALCSSVSLRKAKMHPIKIFLMWFSLCVATAIGSGIGSLLFLVSHHKPVKYLLYLIEGVAAGSMMTVITRTMLPEAFELGGGLVGLSALFGFLSAVSMKLAFLPLPRATMGPCNFNVTEIYNTTDLFSLLDQ